MLGVVLFEKYFEMMDLEVFKFDQQYLFCGNTPQQRSGPLYHTKYNIELLNEFPSPYHTLHGLKLQECLHVKFSVDSSEI